MLRVQSFKITDSDGVNKLLDEHRLAQGASFLVSDGHVMIPYEDGAESTKQQRINALREQKNQMILQRDIIEHSQNVVSFLIQEAEGRIDRFEADLKEVTNEPNSKDKGERQKKIKTEIANARNGLQQLEDQYKQNDHELMRIDINVEQYDVAIQDVLAS